MRYKPSNYHHYYTNEIDILTKMKKGKDNSIFTLFFKI